LHQVVQSKNFTNMKKISLVALGCLAVASVMAQNTEGSGREHKPLRTEMSRAVRFGLQGGINLAKFGLTNFPASTSMKTSFYGGAFVNIPLAHIFRLQPGVMWNGLGSKYTFGSGTTATSSEQDLHYITVPVMLQVVPGHNGFFFEAGPYISYLTTAKSEDQTAGGSSTTEYNKGDFDRTDVGLIGGVGYITRIGLGFTASYLNGFTNVIKDDNDMSNAGVKLRNRAWRFGLVYHFGAAK
jgi:hypothetical protein